MTHHDGTPRRRPALRPLTCGVLLALTTLSTTSALARNLDNESETIDENAPVEDWSLTNGAELTVNGGSTKTIMAMDSRVELNNALVTRDEAVGLAHALELRSSQGFVNGTRLVGGGLMVNGTGHGTLTNSSILIDASAPGMGDNSFVAYGIVIQAPGATGNPSVLLDNSTVSVADRADQAPYSSGIGAYLRAGGIEMKNGSAISAANAGVIVHSQQTLAHDFRVHLDGSHITSGRGAAIEVVAQDDADNTVDIRVSEGSTLTGGDGNLLLVRSFNGLQTTGNSQVNFSVSNSTLEGNITFDDSRMSGRVDVALQANAHLKGIFNNVTAASIGTGSSWTLTGDSTLGHLELGAVGNVVLGDNAGSGQFNTLSLDTFNGSGGDIIFNTVLNGDESATDKLVISGDANGQADVVVRNAGGQGAQTDKGIELITIGGNSNAEFDLLGRAVGGQYEYFLIKGNDGNWYLRSQLDEQPETPHECLQDPTLPQCEITLPVEPIDPENPDPENPDPENPDPENPDPENPDPENPDPEEPSVPQPVLRPETGAYLANQQAMDHLLQHSAQTRMGSGRAEDGIRTWAATDIAESRQHLTGQQRFKSTRQRLQVGADIGVFDRGQGRVGAMLSAGKADATVRSTVTGYRAEATVEGGAVGAYAHWSNDTLYLDASVQHGRFRNTVHGEGLQAERYDSRAWQSAIEAGYRVDLGRIGGLALNLQPQLQLSYTDAATDAHVESNGTVVRSAGASGLSTRLGLRLQGEMSTGSTAFAPYVTVNGYRDSRNAGMAFDGETVLGGLPRQRAELKVGGQLRLGSGLSAWGEIGASHGDDRYRDTAARIGAAYRW
ncbi:autotransporter outer membrane beta-barrel domain-containing protein [Stenotrophomonas sp.]|uniref:autotransporter family protein n=1 Tax=Stenotrophomonas sp. TaxID=69392 RepID=UPI0028AEF06A|nr:autotransporter outer membrane beta-barrel domain-containing protein [Stenotrophomonas sp.]